MAKKKNKTEDSVSQEELEQALAELKIEVREDQIEKCLELMNLFNSCGVSASLVEVDDKQAEGLALAITLEEFQNMKTILVKHIVTMEETSND